MPKEIFPSSYECDCGHQSHFFENTVREVKAISFSKKVYLIDSEPDGHTIVFYRGEMIEILCPNRNHEKPPTRKARNGKASKTKKGKSRGS